MADVYNIYQETFEGDMLVKGGVVRYPCVLYAIGCTMFVGMTSELPQPRRCLRSAVHAAVLPHVGKHVPTSPAVRDPNLQLGLERKHRIPRDASLELDHHVRRAALIPASPA